MFKSITLPCEFDGSWWTICAMTGALLRHNVSSDTGWNISPHSRLAEALHQCDKPYRCKWQATPLNTTVSRDVMRSLGLMHARLLSIGNRRFFFSRLYASWSRPLFETTAEAFSAISRLSVQQERRSELCLQRSLLAAKTSLSFRRKGVLFIGANLESADMHAWIIEAGSQPDHEDIAWINYRPLLALQARAH